MSAWVECVAALPSLTAPEAAERSRLLSVERYDLDVDVAGLRTGPELRAIATIRLLCREPGVSTFVDCAADVARATLNGTDLPSSAVTPGRIALDRLATSNVLVVESVQRSTDQRTGIHRSLDPADDEVYVWTSFEPDDARRTWACFDQPDLKAPHGFTVAAPADWTVLSSSGDPEVSDVAAGRRWAFPATPPLSTYVPALVAGPYAGLHASREATTSGCGAGARCSHSSSETPTSSSTSPHAGCPSSASGSPCPSRSGPTTRSSFPTWAGQWRTTAALPGPTPSCSAHRRPPADREQRGRVLLHEMAHMWFGDILTMRWWDDLWLNEAFAEWAAYWAAVRTGSFPDAWAVFLAGRKLSGYAADRAPTTHPIRQPAPDVAVATAGFDAITYAKGASVLKQLAALVGEEAFVAALRSHFAAYTWSSATLADLVGAVEATSGRDLRRWTQQWLDTARTDTARLVFGPGGPALEVDGYDGAEPREHRVDVGAYVRRDDRLSLLKRVEVTTSGRRTPLPDLRVPADLFLVNDTDLDVVAVHPDPESRAALLDLGHLLPDAVARAVAVSTAWELMVGAEVPPGAFVDLAARTVRRETAESLVEPFLGLALQAAELWAPEGQRPGLLTQVADVALELAATGRAVPGALRALARAASTEAHFDALAGYVGEDLDLGWRRLVRLAALGRLPSDEVAALQARDPDPDVWVRALSVRAAQPSAAAKDEVWDAVVVTPRVPLGDVSEVAAAFWQPDQAELLRPFAERYLDVLPTLGDAGMIQSLAVGNRMFPVVGADRAFVERADELAAAIREPVVARILRERSHELRAMLDVREGVRVEER